MSKLHTQLAKSLLLCAGLALGATPTLAAQVTSNLNVPGTLQLDITGGCDNTGPNITLGPVVTLKNVPVTVVFDGGGDHDAAKSVSVDVSLNLGGTITLPKQGAAPDGVTGNPFISILLNGTTIFGPVRCNKL